VLAIGTVVDDAIVVVEAVQSKFDAGYKSPYLATKWRSWFRPTGAS